MTETQQPLNKLSPFFEHINKYDEPKEKQSLEDEMIGKSSNRILDKKWNVKIQIAADFFTEIFTFIKEMGFNTVFGLSEKMVKIYKLNPDNTHLTYITIDKTEMSEYINNDFPINIDNVQDKRDTETPEQIVYVEFDFLDELYINNKYPIDIYFDTKERNTMYLVNGKTIESRRLNEVENNDASISTYQIHYEKVFRFMNDKSMVHVTLAYGALGTVLTTLEKKKTKKDKKSSGILNIKFGLSDIDFIIGNETKSSSIQMYGDDIAIRGTGEVSLLTQLDFLVKFKKLKLGSNVTFHVNEKLPIVIETRFGAGKVRLFYMIAPRETSE